MQKEKDVKKTLKMQSLVFAILTIILLTINILLFIGIAEQEQIYSDRITGSGTHSCFLN